MVTGSCTQGCILSENYQGLLKQIGVWNVRKGKSRCSKCFCFEQPGKVCSIYKHEDVTKNAAGSGECGSKINYFGHLIF